jgi:hypothetical protein
MSNSVQLSERSKKDLAEMARRRGIRGHDTMNKDELVKALSRSSSSAKVKAGAKPSRLAAKAPQKAAASKPAAKIVSKPAAKPQAQPLSRTPKSAEKLKTAKSSSDSSPSTDSRPSPAHKSEANGSHRAAAAANGVGSTAAASSSGKGDAQKAAAKPAGSPAVPTREAPKDQLPRVASGPAKDRIIMAVHDPYWLHVYWELSAASVQRAEAALKQDWYGARLILRLYDVTSQDTTSTSETPIRDIPIENDGNNWYINVQQPPRQYRADLGYLSRRGILFVLARSNVVTPPKAGSSEAIDAGWNMDTKKAERILAMSTGFESAGNPDLREIFEERLKRSLGAPKETGFGTGATPPGSLKKFFFEIDAKLIVLGRTDPSAHLTLGNDPIKLNSDGTFIMSFSLPDSRQIIPAVATSADGVEERTIVLAVERNTKYLDPMIHDQMNEL